MQAGAVSYYRPQNVKRMSVEKNNPIVNALNKTREERNPDLYKEQQDRQREIIAEKKASRRLEEKQKKLKELEEKKRKEELSYDNIFTESNMVSNSGKCSKANVKIHSP